VAAYRAFDWKGSDEVADDCGGFRMSGIDIFDYAFLCRPI
jgi:hypothetical protein